MKTKATLQDKINLLFEYFRRSDGKMYSNVEVCRATGLNTNLMSVLRTRDHGNPTFATLQGVAKFFNIPLDYFMCETLDEAKEYLSKIITGTSVHDVEKFAKDELVVEIMEKTMSVSVEARQDILRMLEWFEAGDKAVQKKRQPATTA